ncbi:hypothetical protein LshimejAT787_0100440 [Lyophyllum shimeji]|uniref:Uncharacterized protein n=1 Tax=Lyophyllum shimeji TaxID=47721 RepID=A0A9P3UH42_LYOSH|nr:hypothetical protein LshimejAT787_0100440 [Lyophyllum shimeji]
MLQHHHLLYLVLFVYSFLPPLITSQWADNHYAGTQFIFYNGTISGRFVHPPGQSSCPDYHLGPHALTSLFVGVNPPWDDNPFFFDLYHISSTDSLVNTYDSIYNLEFTTAAYVCMKYDQPCGVVEFMPYWFLPVEMVNLTDTKVERVSVGAETGYRVRGDEKTWVGDGTVINDLEVRIPGEDTWQEGCMGSLHYTWNSSIPFTYDMTFSNTTASATFFLNAPYGALTLQFSGDRADSRPHKWPFPAIGLNTSNPTKPTFTYSNGTAFSFVHDPYDERCIEDCAITDLGSQGEEVVIFS